MQDREEEALLEGVVSANNRTNGGENKHRVSGQGGEYSGYKPITAADFPYNEDVERGKQGKSKFGDVDPGMLRDSGQTSVSALILACFLAALFVVLLAWLVLIARCKVNKFCDMLDRSSVSTIPGQSGAAALRIPTVYVWTGLTVSTLCLCIAATYTIMLLRKPVGTVRLVEISTHILECSNALLSCQMQAYLLPALIVFLLIGFGLSWTFAGGFMFGGMITKIVASNCVNVATRANLRTTAAARDGIRSGAHLAFRTGSILGLLITSFGLLGVSAVYLMLEDVRVLVGFSAGSSCVAFICRVIGSIYTSATSMGARLLNLTRDEIPETADPHLPMRFMESGGDRLGDVAGMSVDLFETYVSTVAVTAILGSTLPFFYRNPFALCVFNHLNIDFKCGSFGYPETLSYAIYTCRMENMYDEYPSLQIWQSNSVFIAIPYLLACAGVISSVLCTIRMHSPSAHADEDSDKAGQIHTVLWGIRLNVLLGALILVCCSAGICFGLLGRGTIFQKAAGMGSIDNLKVFSLAKGTKVDTCQPRFQNASSIEQPFPVPQGSLVLGRYKPVSVLGFSFDYASSSDWRLFLCIVIGIGLALLLEYSTEFFTSASSKPVKRVAESSEFGASAIIIQGLGTGMLSAIIPMLLVGFAIMGTFGLYGPYGIALSSVGLLSGLGIVIAADSFGPLSSSSGQIARLADLVKDTQAVTGVLEAAGRTNAATGKILANASGIMCSFALLVPLMVMSRLVPSAIELVGTPETVSKILIGNVVPIPMSDIYVSTSLVLGTMIPFLFSGLLLTSSSKAANAMVVGTRNHIDTVNEMQRHGSFAKARLMTCLGAVRRTSVVEAILPVALVFVTPLIVGFGFGQKALVSFLISTTGTTFVLGTVFSDAGEIWANALKLIELGSMGEENGKDSSWHKSAVISDAVGRSLKETVGSSMNIVMKLMVLLGFLAVRRMMPDHHKGWIGAVIFIFFISLGVPFSVWKWNRNLQLLEAARGRTGKVLIEPPPKQMSPFFMQKPTVEPGTAAPGSQLKEALLAAGDPRVPTDPSTLPGLSTRSMANLDGFQSLTVPGRIVSITESVLLDEARHDRTTEGIGRHRRDGGVSDNMVPSIDE